MIYILIINIISFLIYFTKIDFLIIIFTLLGGTIGEIINIILFDRKNIMNKLFVVCIFIIQIIILILFSNKTINFNIYKLLNNKILLIYILLINIITFFVFYLDKKFAIKNMWRIKIKTLLTFCLLGGTFGALGAIYIFKHKTKVNYFTKGIPLIIIVHFFILLLLINI